MPEDEDYVETDAQHPEGEEKPEAGKLLEDAQRLFESAQQREEAAMRNEINAEETLKAAQRKLHGAGAKADEEKPISFEGLSEMLIDDPEKAAGLIEKAIESRVGKLAEASASREKSLREEIEELKIKHQATDPAVQEQLSALEGKDYAKHLSPQDRLQMAKDLAEMAGSKTTNERPPAGSTGSGARPAPPKKKEEPKIDPRYFDASGATRDQSKASTPFAGMKG